MKLKLSAAIATGAALVAGPVLAQDGSCDVASGSAFENRFVGGRQNYIVDYVTFERDGLEIGRNGGSQPVQVRKAWSQLDSVAVVRRDRALLINATCDHDPSQKCPVIIYARPGCDPVEAASTIKFLYDNTTGGDLYTWNMD